VIRATAVEAFGTRRLQLGEGIAWDAERDELLAVDIDAGTVWLGERCVAFAGPVSMVHPRAGGGYVVATRDGVALIAPDGVTVTPFVELEPGPDTRMNDGACDALGRLWVGSMSTRRVPNEAALYRVEPDGAPTTVLTGVSLSNGLAWSPDGATMYYVDTPTLGIDAFDFDLQTGAIARRRRIVEIDRGRPDGLCVDHDGCLWVALYTGCAVRRYTPDGRLEREIELPASQVTNCCFGGLRLDTLFISTAARNVEQAEPQSGLVFACEPGVTGVPVARFAG
jgi:sugar lactone lactonase YvrE